MSEAYDETHYQIALTNRQVLTAFVALLVCLFVAFFAGVWIGRDSAATDVAQIASADEEPTAGRDQFEFFARTDPAAEADGASTQTAALEAEGKPKKKKRRSEKAESQKSLPPPEPMTRQAETTPPPIAPLDRSEERSAPAPVVEARKAEPPPAPVSTPAATPSSEQAVIQVHAGTDRAQADDLVTRLKAAGYQAFLTEMDGAQPYRVRVGPFANRDLAKARATQLSKELGLETYIPPSGS